MLCLFAPQVIALSLVSRTLDSFRRPGILVVCFCYLVIQRLSLLIVLRMKGLFINS